jgi:hypothetical protein
MRHPAFIAINELDLTAGTQLRAGLDKSAIADYAEGYREFGALHLGAIKIYHVPGLVQPYVLVDGFHRVSAAREAWPEGVELPCICAGSGSLREAILQSAGVNAEHGVRRTDADKRRAVLQILSDAEWVNWSDNKIAKTCNVGNRLVGVLRRELTAAAKTPTEPLSPRLASLSASQVNTAIEAIEKFSKPDRTVERGGTTFTQKSPATERPPEIRTPLLQDLRIYVGPRRLDAKANTILDPGDVVEFLAQSATNLNDIASGLGVYVRHMDEIRDKWLEPIPHVIGDIVPATIPGQPSGRIINYSVIGGTTIDLKFLVDFTDYQETLGMDEIADRIINDVEGCWKDSPQESSIPTNILAQDNLLTNLNDLLKAIWNGDPFQFAIAPKIHWDNNVLPKVIDYRTARDAVTTSREECDVAIVSQFTPNLCDLANGCRQLIITPCNSVILCYSLPGVLVTKHFNPALGCLKI